MFPPAGLRPRLPTFFLLFLAISVTSAPEIQRKFDTVKSVDNDLNGVPDLLEDPVLSAPVPFIGIPFAITGCIEAEQFDRGGQGVAYYSLGGNTVTNDYRPSMMQIVTNTTDFAAGFIVDNLRAGEWLKYTLDVRVGQFYAVDARVAGIGTGGVFRVEFASNATAAPYLVTGPITVPTTNWTNLKVPLLYLLPFSNTVMKVVMATNSADNAVCRLNYISLYPSWVEGVPNLVTNFDVTVLTNNDSSWAAATHNAERIRDALNQLNSLDPTDGGSITIPSGTYYVAQPDVQEGLDAEKNSVALISRSHVEIKGAGKTNTMLIAHNRATTIFYVGRSNTFDQATVTNFTLRDLTVEGRPHLVATNAGANGFLTFWETGALNNIDGPVVRARGNLVVFGGVSFPSARPSVNLLFTNCVFRNPSVDGLWSEISCISNVAVRNCDFVFRDGTNGAFPFPRSITNTNISTTITNPPTPLSGVGFFVRVCGTLAQNVLMLDCAFNGNPALTALPTNNTNFDAGDGIYWTQAGVNCFVGRCGLTNYGLEGIQFGDGPAAAVANDFRTFVSYYATVGIQAVGSILTITGSSNDNTFYAVGNRIVGGRFGYWEKSSTNSWHSRPNFSGNYIELTPPYDLQIPNYDNLGAAFEGAKIEHANIAGNKLVAGGHGARWHTDAISGLVLKNDFAAASFRALAYTGTNANAGPAFRFTILRNALGQGSQFHLKGPAVDPGIFFSSENTFKAGPATVNPFVDPASAPVHTRHKP